MAFIFLAAVAGAMLLSGCTTFQPRAEPLGVSAAPAPIPDDQ
jgi:hypothetical protein